MIELAALVQYRGPIGRSILRAARLARVRLLAMRAETLRALERHLIASAARPRTISTYLRIARLFGQFIEPRELRTASLADAERFLARGRRTGQPSAVSTRNVEIVALRTLYRAMNLADPTAAMPLKRPARRDPAVPTVSELRALFEAAARGPTPARDLAILALLFQAGLRVHELVALTVDQIDVPGRVLLDLLGKGATRTDQPLGDEATLLVSTWISERGTHPGALFPQLQHGAISVRSVQRLLGRLRGAAGIAKRLTPHSLRHGTATLAIARGVDLPTVASLLRHARIETTMLYIALASEARREAANRLGGAIPRSVLPSSRNSSERRVSGGAQAPVDVEDAFDDAA